MRGWSLGFLLVGASAVSGQAVTAVPKLDVNRFAVGWYEIARLPNRAEKPCVSNSLQVYALSNKARRLQVVDSCLLKDGEANVRNLTAKVDKAGDGRLKVGSLFLFSTKEWVLAVGPDYEWALVGSPNHKLLWVLSRTAQMDSGVLQQVEGIASAQGFKTAKLQIVQQGK